MPIDYSLTTPDIDIHVMITGVVSPADVGVYMRDLMKDFESLDGTRALIEIDSLKPRGFKYMSMRGLAVETGRFESKLEGSRTAILAASALAFGLARMYVLMRNPPYTMSVFREREPAMQWLHD